MQSPPRRLSLTDLNTHLVCVLCGGYLIDATTIIECLHSFCRTCIYQYLASNKYCPICEVQVHKTKPLVNVRPDKTMQTLVYKLVPGLQKEEMRRRQEFYSRNTLDHVDTSTLMNTSEYRGSLSADCRTVSQLGRHDGVSICLQLSDRLPPLMKPTFNHESIIQKFVHVVNDRRFLFCPANMTVGHLKRFLKFKLDLPSYVMIDIFHSNVILQELYTLWDIANIYTWRQTEPLKLYYVMYSMLKPSSTVVRCDVKNGDHPETHNMGQEDSYVVEKIFNKECAWSVNCVSLQSLDSVCACAMQPVSSSVYDVRNVNKSLEVPAITDSDPERNFSCASELKRSDSVETGVMVADMQVTLVECENIGLSASNETLHSVAAVAPVETGSKCLNAGDSVNMKSGPNNNDQELLASHSVIPQSNGTVSETLASEEKIGFERDAITSTDHWPRQSVIVERRVKRHHGEVRRLLVDENGRGMKRELRAPGRQFSGARRQRNTRLSPLQRLRKAVKLLPSNSG